MEDIGVTDILINGTHSLYVERDGHLVSELRLLPVSILCSTSSSDSWFPSVRRVDAAHPYLDGRLVDGSRFHVILPPIAPEGPLISIRKHRTSVESVPLESFGPDRASRLATHSSASAKEYSHRRGNGDRQNHAAVGAYLLRCRSTERMGIVEESLEIRSPHPHVFRLEARPASPDGTGEVTLRSLLRNTLRMRPDRIILGGVPWRGGL